MAPLIPIAISLAAKYVPDIIAHFSGKNAAGVAEKVLEVAQQVTGSATPDEAAKALAASPELALKFKLAVMEQEKSLKELDVAADKQANEAITERWKADMASDSWLSKNIRPGALVWLMALMTILVLADVGWRIKIQDNVAALIETLLQIVFGAYFLGRTLEKGLSIWKKNGH